LRIPPQSWININRLSYSTKARTEADQRFKVAKRAAILLKRVSDATRLQIILALAEGEQHVGALCERFGQSPPAVSHHLALLRHGSIVVPKRVGKSTFYTLTETGETLARVIKQVVA
jgi:DNA-binding transcriptional ArsR family regulator